MDNNKMTKSIVLCASLFGSVYLMSTSLVLMNKSFIENKKNLSILNGLIFLISSSIFIGGTISILPIFKSSMV